MATQGRPKKKHTQTKNSRSEYFWPEDRPPLDDYLRQQEKFIRRVASRSMCMAPEYQDDMAQELRLRAIRAWETWDPKKGPLATHAWRYIVGSHLGLLRRTWTCPLGYRYSRRTAPSIYSLNATIGDDDDEFIDNVAGGDDVPEEAILARGQLAAILPRIKECIGKQISMEAALERLIADQGEIVDVARKQGVSIQAVYSSRNRMLAAIRAALEVEDD
jgi:hypothetical protein